MPFTGEHISGNEILDELYKQYGTRLYMQPCVEGDKKYRYSGDFIECFCNRCGSKTSLPPKLMLEAYDNRLPLCLNCGGNGEEQVRQEKENLRNEPVFEVSRNERSEIMMEEKKPPEEMDYEYKEIEIKLLEPYPGYEFTEYDEKKLSDMVNSIKTVGVLEPILVRPSINDGFYQILSGHNRKKAAEAAGLGKISAVVRKGLAEADAELIVAGSNLNQRSFMEMKPSGRAFTLYTLYQATKMIPGSRTDLACSDEEPTSSQNAMRSPSYDKVGKQYGLSGDAVYRYVRIHKLNKDLKRLLDEGRIVEYVAAGLSFFTEAEQSMFYYILQHVEGKLSIDDVKVLRKKSKDGRLKNEDIANVLEKKRVSHKIKSPKLSDAFLLKYYVKYKSPEDFEKEVAEALDEYFAKRNQ